MKEYHKIKWIYAFDEKTHLPKSWIIDYFQPLRNLERQFTEKIDWTNIRVYWDWHKVRFWGRTEKSQIPVKLLDKLQDIFIEELFEQKFWETEVTLYWEWYWGKIQSWKRDYLEEENFILFDVNIWDMRLERDNIEAIAKSLWIKCVPIVCIWHLVEWISWVIDNCLWNDKNDKQIEWVVWIPMWWYYDRMWKRIIVKIKQEHFKK